VFSQDMLDDFHRRTHGIVQTLLSHCGRFTTAELDRELAGFGYPTIRSQLHHGIAAEKYWVGVVRGHVDVDDNFDAYPTARALERFRQEVFSDTGKYLSTASAEELNTQRHMMTWGNKGYLLVPAHIIMRTQTHYYHHAGQVAAMCRLIGRPCDGLDYPIIVEPSP